MHSIPIAVLVALATTLPIAAQRGIFTIYPDDSMLSTSFTDRGSMSLNGNPGELLNELPQGLVSGIGQTGGACSVVALVAVLQDENAATVETFGVVARPRAASGTGPDTSSTIYQAGGIQTPQQTGRQSWLVTLTYQTPQPIPCSGGFFHGFSLPPAPGWAQGNDGLSMHMAHYTLGTLGEHARPGAPDLGWSIDGTTAQATSHSWVFANGYLASGPTLQVGAVDPANTRTAPLAGQGTTTFGVGGFFPDVSASPRSDGLEVRLFDAGAPGALTGILFSFGSAPQPLPIVGIGGELRIDPTSLFGFAGAPLSTSAPERAIVPFLPPGSLAPSLAANGATVYFQGVVLDPIGGPWLTNSVGVRF